MEDLRTSKMRPIAIVDFIFNILVQKIPNFQIPNSNLITRGIGEFWNLDFPYLEFPPLGLQK